jgi:hypothetical protein
MKRYAIFALLAFALTGCDGAIDSEYKEQIVVTAFMYTGQPIDSIVLHYSVPFGSYYVDEQYAVGGSDVRLKVDGKEYQFIPGTRKGRYYSPDSSLRLEGGKEYQLFITKGEHNVYAYTKAPMPIQYTGLDDSLPADRILPLDTNNASTFAYGVTAGPRDESWRLYMLGVTSLDTSYGRIYANPNAGPPVDTSSIVRYSFIQTAPNVRIYSRLFSYFGPNRLTMLSMDSNWVFYKRQVGYGAESFIPYQSSLNHVKGGLGVFASAAKDTVTVFVKYVKN